MAIRPAGSSLVAKPLGHVHRVVVASPAYLRQAPPLRRPADLAPHRCLICSLSDAQNEWPLQDGTRSTSVAVSGHYRVNNSLMLREAVAQGLGVALTPLFVVDDLFCQWKCSRAASGTYLPAAHTVYGVVTHHRHMLKKLSVFFDFIAAALAWQAMEERTKSSAPTTALPLPVFERDA